MTDIVRELTDLAADAQQVKYRSKVQFALLDAAVEIRRLRARLELTETAHMAQQLDAARATDQQEVSR
jgi:hypothetical protein